MSHHQVGSWGSAWTHYPRYLFALRLLYIASVVLCTVNVSGCSVGGQVITVQVKRNVMDFKGFASDGASVPGVWGYEVGLDLFS